MTLQRWLPEDLRASGKNGLQKLRIVREGNVLIDVRNSAINVLH